jgi:outer membrane murein-binding lipoprotein Lpp
MDDERIAERLAAVECAVSNGASAPDLVAAAEAVDTASDRDERIDDLAERVADLEAATQALRGYVGAVRSDDGDLADRVDRTTSAVSDLEARVEALEAAGGRPESVGDASAPRAPEEARTDNEVDRPGRSPTDTADPDWLARADERLPVADDPSSETTDDDAGLATRLAGLL